MVKLDEYAETQGKRWKGCWACQHPERAQIDTGIGRGHSTYLIANWCADSGDRTSFRTLVDRLDKHVARCLRPDAAAPGIQRPPATPARTGKGKDERSRGGGRTRRRGCGHGLAYAGVPCEACGEEGFIR